MGNFIVNVDDNYYWPGEKQPYQDGTFDTMAEAESRCEQIVDGELRKAVNPGTTPDELYEGYCAGGLDPWVEGSGFSARNYARKRCMDICREAKSGVTEVEPNITPAKAANKRVWFSWATTPWIVVTILLLFFFS